MPCNPSDKTDWTFDEPFLTLCRQLAALARAGQSPWFLPEALAVWHDAADPAGLSAIGWTMGDDGKPHAR
jgi:hypothetical protein